MPKNKLAKSLLLITIFIVVAVVYTISMNAVVSLSLLKRITYEILGPIPGY